MMEVPKDTSMRKSRLIPKGAWKQPKANPYANLSVPSGGGSSSLLPVESRDQERVSHIYK